MQRLTQVILAVGVRSLNAEGVRFYTRLPPVEVGTDHSGRASSYEYNIDWAVLPQHHHR